MKKLPLALGAGVFSLALVLTGCSDASAPTGENTAPSDTSSTVTANDADEMFVTMMIPHHQQAIEMADIVLAKDGLDPAVAELAQQIKDAQGPEMERMLGWLDDWGVEYEPDDMGGMDHGSMDDSGDGMMSEEDMATLEEADATQASRIFLEQMIVHHDGAIEMSEDLLEDGEDAEMRALAESIVESQTAEIAEMQALLQEI